MVLRARQATLLLTTDHRLQTTRIESPLTLYASHSRLSNHLIRSRQHIRRDRQTDLFGRFQIDDELELLRLLHCKIGGLGAFQDLIHISGSAPEQIVNTRPVSHETPVFHKFWPGVCRRKPALYRQLYNLYSMSIEDDASQHNDSISAC